MRKGEITIGCIATKKTEIMEEEKIKKLPLLEYILYIDSLSTEEFCNWQGIKHPFWTGDVKSSANMFLQVDVVKLRLIKEKAKLENRKEIEIKKQDYHNSITLIEFGFKQSEKGNNLQYAINEYNNLTTKK